jgi:hypothetical protein
MAKAEHTIDFKNMQSRAHGRYAAHEDGTSYKRDLDINFKCIRYLQVLVYKAYVRRKT